MTNEDARTIIKLIESCDDGFIVLSKDFVIDKWFVGYKETLQKDCVMKHKFFSSSLKNGLTKLSLELQKHE